MKNLLCFRGIGSHGIKRALRLEKEMAHFPILSSPQPIFLEVEVRPEGLSINLRKQRFNPITSIEFNKFQINTSSSIYTGPLPSKKQPLIRAIGVKKKRRILVLDGTCGLGEDTYLMARYGFSVVGIEKNPLLYIILRDTLARLGVDYPFIVRRIRIIQGDCVDIFYSLRRQKNLISLPDVVYLDPMYPVGYKRRAKEKKNMQFLRLLIGEGREEETKILLGEALKIARYKVVIKRPKRYPPLSIKGILPSHKVVGRGHRFDIYVPKG